MCALKDESSERADFYQGAHALKTASFRDYLSRNQLNYAQSCWQLAPSDDGHFPCMRKEREK